MDQNTKNRPVLILLITIILLLASNLLPSGELIWGIQLKRVDILMDIRVEIQEEEIDYKFDEEIWDEDDDFFEDDPPLPEEDTVKTQ